MEIWAINGRIGYIIPMVWGGGGGFRVWNKIRRGHKVGGLTASPLLSGGVPNTVEQGTKSELADKWVCWQHHPFGLGGA